MTQTSNHPTYDAGPFPAPREALQRADFIESKTYDYAVRVSRETSITYRESKAMKKHTEGKWEALKTSKGWNIGAKTTCVATVPYIDAEACGNAHLIAAAPEMFKLLKSIQQSRTFTPSDFDLVDQVIARANNAE